MQSVQWRYGKITVLNDGPARFVYLYRLGRRVGYRYLRRLTSADFAHLPFGQYVLRDNKGVKVVLDLGSSAVTVRLG